VKLRLTLAALCAATSLAAAPARGQPAACARACEHMRVIGDREFARELAPKLSKEERETITRQAKAKEPERLATCMARCRAGRFDPGCVLRAASTAALFSCMSARPGAGGPPARPDILSPEQRQAALKAAAAVKGKPIPLAAQKKILKLLDAVKPADRLSLLGAALAESAAGMYGADLVGAFKAIATVAPDHRRLGVLRELTVPLAAIGCAPAVVDAVKLVPAQQNAHLLAHCPPAGKPRLMTATHGVKAPAEVLALALVLQHRARASGFAANPLHRRAIEVLLQAR
jgi:hypothetical protein